MAQIRVSDLTFSYDNSADDVLENVSFSIDTDWKLGLIGRNGKGKTTLLSLLMGKYEYQGSISSSTRFDYFPYQIDDEDMKKTADELIPKWKPQVEPWQVMVQINQLELNAECLYRPFSTLSHGERTQVMLAVLFADENEFLLIDEPTNHLDQEAREVVKKYLSGKKGFILVSHDRDLLDAVCDHVLVLNRQTVEVQTGNFSSWWENKEKSDAFAMAENEKHLKEISKLRAAADRNNRWAIKNEATKIGYDPIEEHDRFKNTRSYIGAKTKKMEASVKNFEKRVDREIEEKEGLLQDIESVDDLQLRPLKYHKDVLVNAKEMTLSYPTIDGDNAAKSFDESDGESVEAASTAAPLFPPKTFQIRQGERVILAGDNGCGKSSIIKAILERLGSASKSGSGKSIGETESGNSTISGAPLVEGALEVGAGLTISYINQDTSFLSGDLKTFCEHRGLDYSLFLAILRKLDFGRQQFAKNMEDYSEGQKKKVLIAASLITPAHLYIWDEPLNYIDVFSRMQIEKLILDAQPTMLIVEHDTRFQEKIATKIIRF